MMPGDPHSPDDPLGLLMACHDRIRRFLGGFEALVALEDPRDPRAAPTAASCARYFREGLSLHGEDEDASISPRLLALSPGAAVVEAIAVMEEEHVAIHAGLPEALAALDATARGEVVPLEAPCRWLSTLLIGHIEAEEALIFPSLMLLPPEALDAIVDEIRARRR